MRCYNSYYSSLILLSLLFVSILNSKGFTLPNSCQIKCGKITIPYPFGIQGIEEGCYLNEWYKIECRNSSSPFLLKLGLEVVNISLPRGGNYFHTSTFSGSGSIRVKSPVTSVGCSGDGKEPNSILNLTNSPFLIRSDNSLVAFGCSSKSMLTNIEPSIAGCQLDCTKNKVEEKISCDGNGCCRASIPGTQQVIGIRIESFDNGNSTRGGCRVAFLTDEVYKISNATKPGSIFTEGYSTITLKWLFEKNSLSFKNSLGCRNGEEYNSLKDYSLQRTTSCICKNVTISGTNYTHCGCNNGYTGNPYLSDGCIDVDECLQKRKHDGSGMHCRPSDTCKNVPGDFICKGDPTGAIMIGIGAGFGVLLLVGGIWLLRKFLKNRKLTRRKRKFFKRNGGLLLKQQLNTYKGNVEKTKIFNSRELENATENFSYNRILGQGGQGTVFKGMLVDGKIVAVKKSKIVDEDKLEEFINEIVILSQVNHRHVVKLLGCCLETEVPILVYEFIPNGNLFQHIHDKSDDYTMIWGVRLRIAVDIAGALSYLHSAACSPVYHRDVKSTNILLDEKYRAKVSDFGTSRSVKLDDTHWTTVISGTVGYMDPEYYGSSQYTEKSDVYSFGVILVELITGEKPVITLPDSQEIKGLADHFKAAMKENKFFDIMDARIKDACKPEQVMAVAKLARRCLNSKGKKRPYMREVFAELEKICSSPEDSLAKLENEDGADEEEDGMNIIEIGDSWTIGVTAPASNVVPSSSLSDVEPLFPRRTW